MIDEDGMGWLRWEILKQLTNLTYNLKGWRGWDRMIRWEIIKQLKKSTYFLEMDEEVGMIRWEILNKRPSLRTAWKQMKRMGWDNQMRDLKQYTKFTYSLETDEEDGIGWETLKKLKKFTYSLETIEDNQMRDPKTIDEVHILSGNNWRRWDGMIRCEILKQLTMSTYILETDEVDGMGWSVKRF